MILAVDGTIKAVIGAADPIKPNAIKAVERLKALGIEIAMITGDNKMTADKVASQIGIERVFAEVMPADKASYVKKLQQEGKLNLQDTLRSRGIRTVCTMVRTSPIVAGTPWSLV